MSSALRTAYAWVLLSVIVLPLFPAMFVLRPILNRTDPSGDRFRRFTAQWVSFYARLTPLYRFTLNGIQHLPNTGPYVLVANHESGLDVLALLLLRAPVRFLAETWMFRIPLAGWLFRACRHIPVKPGDRETGHRALETAEEALAEGTPVAIFPEGRLCPDHLGEFKPGAFVLASRARVPLIPVVLEGTGEAWRPGTVVVHGAHEIRVRVLEAIEADADETPDDLARRTRGRFETSRNRGTAAKAAAQTS
ncbi:MAG: lysophospholipid acyltransferase family protein [Candidatus Binatia bacterium]|nr:lysophospholipid acyltransferase family protein [Candidatus Binatia bacterium]